MGSIINSGLARFCYSFFFGFEVLLMNPLLFFYFNCDQCKEDCYLILMHL
jgi:hypothetical protein